MNIIEGVSDNDATAVWAEPRIPVQYCVEWVAHKRVNKQSAYIVSHLQMLYENGESLSVYKC